MYLEWENVFDKLLIMLSNHVFQNNIEKASV